MDLNKPLPIELQIEVLDNIDWEMLINTNSGLCTALTISVFRHPKLGGFKGNLYKLSNEQILQYHEVFNALKTMFPLFNPKEASFFSSRKELNTLVKSLYWFDISEQGLIERENYI